jgi:hypothetical protein
MSTRLLAPALGLILLGSSALTLADDGWRNEGITAAAIPAGTIAGMAPGRTRAVQSTTTTIRRHALRRATTATTTGARRGGRAAGDRRRTTVPAATPRTAGTATVSP